eukprot:TRINITY_DN2109_c0_g2_i6.p2 TRINITY_DN2109_c0_g2~~TRINITY_DN2109_c0_g2_i6.p2  ORF type:complete len:130 (-),score=20.19 TRINITY_DN2109_c0_g2_i6:85-474(-)
MILCFLLLFFCFFCVLFYIFIFFFFFLMIRRPPRSTQGVSSAASDVYKRQYVYCVIGKIEDAAIQMMSSFIVLRMIEIAIHYRNSGGVWGRLYWSEGSLTHLPFKKSISIVLILAIDKGSQRAEVVGRT